MLSDCVSSRQQLGFHSPFSVQASPRAPLRIPRIAPFLCNSKLIHSKRLSAPISPLESALTNSCPVFRISLKTNGRQVLCNQHLRVFASQVLWIQHLHKNTGRGVPPLSSTIPACPAATSAEALGLGDERPLRVPPAPSKGTWSERRATQHYPLATSDPSLLQSSIVAVVPAPPEWVCQESQP